MARCHHCNRLVGYKLKRRLCKPCYSNPDIKNKYPALRPAYRNRDDQTEEELEELIAVQSANKPEWWEQSYILDD